MTALGLQLRAEMDALKARHAKLSPEYRARIQASIDESYELQAEREATHCSECEQEWCVCDDAHDNALTSVRVSPIGGEWFRAEAA